MGRRLGTEGMGTTGQYDIQRAYAQITTKFAQVTAN